MEPTTSAGEAGAAFGTLLYYLFVITLAAIILGAIYYRFKPKNEKSKRMNPVLFWVLIGLGTVFVISGLAQ